MLSVRHTLASRTDTKATISNSEIKKLLGQNPIHNDIILYYHDFNCSIKYHSSRNGQTWYADSKFPSSMTLPKIGVPIFYNVSVVVDDILQGLGLTSEFEPIREWAQERGLYEKGDVKTQTIKLQEEVGELSRAVLKQEFFDLEDSIGDIVVVLTNLAELANLNIETCINKAYSEIQLRKGEMVNGTFVKND
jgi:NTP pyrophosphatase (non-canonical NTP hydrolase)